MKLTAHIESVGLYAPGLEGWRDSCDVLAGTVDYTPSPLTKYKPILLPTNERRRATSSVRTAFGACEDAIGERIEEAAHLAAVFASSGGDYGIHDQICRGLLREDIAVSPTHFHNSVHNAAAGYWSIATASRAPSVSLSAYDYTVATGFLEALPLICLENLSTLLVLADCAVVGPMHRKRPVDSSFACALWLTPGATENSIAQILIELDVGEKEETPCKNSALETLRQNNPSARVLPLLELVAAGDSGSVTLSTSSDQPVRISVKPTST
ncbi:MAG: beta-ketoacyl synthase chain length factor [Halioglobus sp.]